MWNTIITLQGKDIPTSLPNEYTIHIGVEESGCVSAQLQRNEYITVPKPSYHQLIADRIGFELVKVL